MTPKAVMEFARENECTMVDVKFLDFVGLWQHFTIPIQEFDEGLFEHGHGFDGSSIRGWQPSHASDMLVVPDPATAKVDPFPRERTLHLIGNVFDPLTREPYSRDPRHIAQRAEAYLRKTGIADASQFGPEAEFFVFDDIRFDQTRNSGFYFIDSEEGRWNTARDEQPNLGYKPRYQEGYFPAPPVDSQSDLRNEMVVELLKVGIHVKLQHHGVATGGQGEIDLKCAPLVQQGDNLQWLKYILKNVARRNGKTLTFMPKPLFEDHGSGLHVHQSLWKKGKNLFAGDQFGGLSQLALWYVGGLLRHAPALCALCNPSTNSYRRLVPGCEAPVHLAYSSGHRSAAVRVPRGTVDPKARGIEFRTPDPSCNGYLALAAMLMAGLDGIANRIDPGQPLGRDGHGPSAEELSAVPSTPARLEDALAALEADHEFLLQGDVFTADAVAAWVAYKRQAEVDPVRRRPVPWEFALYFDC
ncbi:MAG: type I glutamate--ammonia ligase [Deferrisomatales bacterium]